MTSNNELRCYTNTGTLKTIKRCQELNVGLLIVSPKWVNPDRWPYYAIDNGAFANWRKGKSFDPKPFLKILNRSQEYEREPDFVVLPDIVAGGLESLRFSMEWLSKLPIGFRYYLAVQDGMEFLDVIRVMDKVDGLFVGGSLDWKLKTAKQWCNLASEHGKKCHIGRVGPINRIVWARRIGATSIDSTTWVQRNGVIEYVAIARKQTTLKEASI